MITQVGQQFDVEHAIVMHAHKFAQLPAAGIYDPEALKVLGDAPKRCHIYIIGALPNIEIIWVKQVEQNLVISLLHGAKIHDVDYSLKPGYELKHEYGEWFIDDGAGGRGRPKSEDLMWLLNRKVGVPFSVLYIGQAYGKDGDRNALDRLKSHEKLQEIAVRGLGPAHQINLLLIEVVPATRVITKFNPKADQKDEDGSRLTAGVDKLFGTTESERISLYEAAMIRYFQPLLNKEFKDSFPSTNMKLLQDCYAKDFTAVVAEFGFDELPYALCTQAVNPRDHHSAYFDLHDDAKRKAFFASA